MLGKSAAQKAPGLNLATANLTLAAALSVCVRVAMCRGKSAAQKVPRINLATASLSTASIQHLKNRKLDLCTARLAEMGFKGRRDAARMMGGEPEAAFELIVQCEIPS